MRTVRIYSAEPLTTGGKIALSESAARHVAQVLRLSSGDELTLFDGSGLDYTATIESATKSQVIVRLGPSLAPVSESPLHTSLWHGLCRGDRLDTVVQKATELGVSEVQPVMTERDIVRLDAKRASRKLEHWRAIAISACEQSGRTRLPVIHPAATLAECLQTFREQKFSGTALMCDPDGELGLQQHLRGNGSVIVLTGPEGGFSHSEKTAAAEAGFTLVSLGPRILRTETAPVVILSLIQSMAGDLGR